MTKIDPLTIPSLFIDITRRLTTLNRNLQNPIGTLLLLRLYLCGFAFIKRPRSLMQLLLLRKQLAQKTRLCFQWTAYFPPALSWRDFPENNNGTCPILARDKIEIARKPIATKCVHRPSSIVKGFGLSKSVLDQRGSESIGNFV